MVFHRLTVTVLAIIHCYYKAKLLLVNSAYSVVVKLGTDRKEKDTYQNEDW